MDKTLNSYSLYGPELRGVREIEARILNITLSDDLAEKMGAYHSDTCPGEIEYMKRRDGSEEVRIGVAENDGKICSFSTLSSSHNEFTRDEVNFACSLIQDVVKDYYEDPKFELREEVLADTMFIGEDEPEQDLD